MVAELAPLIIYLKHIVGNKFTSTSNGLKVDAGKDVLFIEEPETHLHPEIQVGLMELFAKLSQLGLKIFITSHSDYMFNKLNNMILAKGVDHEKIAVYHLVRTNKGTIQNPDMQVTKDGIEDDNFQDVSVQLYEERMKILEAQ